MNDEYDGYIVVSFSNATLVLSIGETVEEVNDSGFLGTVPTIRVQLLQDNSLIQASPGSGSSAASGFCAWQLVTAAAGCRPHTGRARLRPRVWPCATGLQASMRAEFLR